MIAILLALSFVSDCESATTGCTPATRAVSDLIVTCAYKASLTAPSAPTGYTAIASTSASASVSSQNCACRIATNTASDAVAWTSTAGVGVAVYRGQKDTTTCTNNFGGVATGTGAATTLTYPAVTMSITDGTSWLYGFAGQTTATNLSTNGTPAGKTQRAATGAIATATQWDTNAGVSSDGAVTATITSANRWRAAQLEILAAPPPCVTSICYVGSAANNNITAAASESLAYVGTAGNDVCVTPFFDPGKPITSVTDSASQSYTLQSGPQTNAGGYATATYCGHLTSGITTVNVNFSGTPTFTSGIMAAEYSGVAAYGNSGSSTSGAAVTNPSVSATSQNANNWIVGFIDGDNSAGKCSAATSGTLRLSPTGNAGGTPCVIDNGPGAGSLTTAGTFSVSNTYNAQAVELCATNPCTGGGGTPDIQSMMGFFGGI